jgi:hypothetical protein
VPAFVVSAHRGRFWSMAEKSQPERPAGRRKRRVLDASIFVKCTLEDRSVFDSVGAYRPCLAPFSEVFAGRGECPSWVGTLTISPLGLIRKLRP